jgi:demethylspheroidene O-methyltransferase
MSLFALGERADGAKRARWRDMLFDWRNRLLADQRFQRFAATFPLTRGIARRRANDLFDLGAGFVYAQIELACVELDLFEKLRHGAREVDELAPALALGSAATRTLCDAAASLGLLESRGEGRYGLGMLGAAFLGNPGLGAMIRHHKMLYADLADPVALLRGEAGATRIGRYWAYAREADPASSEGRQVAAYSELMASTQGMIAEDVLEVAGIPPVGAMMDIGGGEGAFLSAVARARPTLNLVLFDLPAVAARAEAGFARAGLSARTRCVGGDFNRDQLPRGADVISLVRVLHDHDDAVVRSLLTSVEAALAPGGRVVIAEPLAGTPGSEAMGHAYFGFYLMAMGQGRPRTARELSAFLADAGLGRVELRKTRRPLLSSVLVATRSAQGP